MKKIHFDSELQERLASFSWWVFRVYYLPNLLHFSREDWEDIRQEIYLFSYSIPIQGMPTSKKQTYKLIHAMLYRALRKMGFMKPKGQKTY